MDIYIINLKKRPEKLEKILSRLPQCLKDQEVNIVEAIDGSKENIPKWFSRSKHYPESLPGRYGCYKSHEKILKAVNKTSLILEDDAIFKNDFCESFIKLFYYIDNLYYDMFYLGCSNAQKPKHYKDNIYKVSKALRTHAYIVNKNSAKKLYDYISNPAIWQHYLLPDMYHIDHLYSKLQLDERIKAYCCYPAICGQEATDISDVSPHIGPIEERWDKGKY